MILAAMALLRGDVSNATVTVFEVVLRISVIVDARFSLIVDGETASSRVRRGRRASTRFECTLTVHDQPETPTHQGRCGAGFGVGLISRFQAPARPPEAPRPGHVLMSGPACLGACITAGSGARRSVGVAHRPSALELDFVA